MKSVGLSKTRAPLESFHSATPAAGIVRPDTMRPRGASEAMSASPETVSLYATTLAFAARSNTASSAGSASEYGIRDALNHFGVRDSEYKILSVGGTDARVHALQQGIADAAIISPPYGLIAQKLGFREIINLMEMKMLFGYGGLAGKESWLKQNRGIVLAFFKSYLEGLALLRRDTEYALKVIGKYSRVGDREILLESYRTGIPHIPTRPYVKREIVDKALRVSKNSNARNAELERFYDNSFVKTLDDAGFLNSLFGSP